MIKFLSSLTGLLFACGFCAQADALMVADEFPAMEVLAGRLKAEEGIASKLVDQGHLPQDLAQFQAVVVYIHKDLAASVERACIDYTKAGGRLIVLHHSISSGKRQNRDWFSFLGVALPTGGVNEGGYKWTEDVTVDWVNLAGNHFIMTNQVQYPRRTAYTRPGDTAAQELPCFTLRGTEVYLNHVLSGNRTLLMGLKYTDRESGKTWMQDTAGWFKPSASGWVIYFMPGHTSLDFEDEAYGRIVLNAIAAPASAFKP